MQKLRLHAAESSSDVLALPETRDWQEIRDVELAITAYMAILVAEKNWVAILV